MNKVIASMAVVSAMVGLSILIMTQGWGLQPKSWWWIIGGGVVGQVFLKFIADKVLNAKE